MKGTVSLCQGARLGTSLFMETWAGSACADLMAHFHLQSGLKQEHYGWLLISLFKTTQGCLWEPILKCWVCPPGWSPQNVLSLADRKIKIILLHDPRNVSGYLRNLGSLSRNQIWYMTNVMATNRSIYLFTPERPRDLSARAPGPAPQESINWPAQHEYILGKKNWARNIKPR